MLVGWPHPEPDRPVMETWGGRKGAIVWMFLVASETLDILMASKALAALRSQE